MRFSQLLEGAAADEFFERSPVFSDPARIILHPTDFSPESELAFAHALRVALDNKATLYLLHVGASDAEWDQFPSVRGTLQRWGLLEEGAHRHEVAEKLGIRIEKVVAHEKHIVGPIAGFLEEHPVDLLVVATEGRSGLAAWLRPSKAELAARKTHVPTLFVPTGVHGCVSLEHGTVAMDRVLIPVDHQPQVGAAVERGLRAIEAYGHDESRLTLLHVGSDTFPRVRIPQGPWTVEQVIRQGEAVTEILEIAKESSVNLLIMVTQGHHGFLDALRGTTTEQVLRRAPCPVLAVPADY